MEVPDSASITMLKLQPSREVQSATQPAQVDSLTVFAVDRQQDGSMD